MNAMAQDDWQEQADDPEVRIDGRVDPEREDAWWQRVWWTEPYRRGGLEYEDYAPAYCVGYIGFAQYGGRYEEAEKCLCANWLRIRGDSRLSLEEALQAIRAAWNHAAQAASAPDEAEEEFEGEYIVAPAQAQRQPAYA